MNLKVLIKLILPLLLSTTSLKSQQNTIAEDHFKRNDIRINYHHNGASERDLTVLFIHGWCIDGSYWLDQLNYLNTNTDYGLVAIDLPAHGKSGKSQRIWTPEEFGADVAALIDHLDLQQVILVGHSMGGDIMLEAALKQTDKVIGLIGVDNFKDAGVTLDAATTQAMEQFLETLANNYTATVNFFASQYLFSPETDEASKQRVVSSLLQADSVVAAEILTELFVYSPQEIPKLAQLNKKLYLINSDVTPTLTTHMEAQNIKVEVIDIAGTGHYPMIEKPQDFTGLLNKTIKKLLHELEN